MKTLLIVKTDEQIGKESLDWFEARSRTTNFEEGCWCSMVYHFIQAVYPENFARSLRNIQNMSFGAEDLAHAYHVSLRKADHFTVGNLDSLMWNAIYLDKWNVMVDFFQDIAVAKPKPRVKKVAE